MREIKINVDPPEMMFVEDELMIMLLDTIKIIPKAGCVEYFGLTYEQSADGKLFEKGRWGMQKFDEINMVGPVDQNNEYK